MEESATAKAVVEPPRGSYPARVDDKGRLKLPVVFQKYLEAMGTELFVTSLDFQTARIYPLSVWRQNENLFEEMSDDPEAVEDVAFIANDLGAESQMDSQGRVTIHPELRRELKIENQPVYLDCLKGRINVYSEAVYQQRKERAAASLAEKLKTLERKGLR